MIFAIHLIFLGLLSWTLFQISRKLPLRVHFFPFLILKFCAGIAFGLVHYYFYAHYAHGDTFVMFKQSLEGETGSFWKSFFDYDFGKDGSQRANFLIIILEKINKITLQNYWITNAYFSLLSFTGFWFLANKIVEIFPSTKYPTLIGFLYLPTTLFWTSGISKECIMMQTINTLVFVCLQLNFLWHKTKQWQILVACLFFIANSWILLKLKYYYFAVLLPILISFSIANFLLSKNFSIKKVVVFFIANGLILVLIISFLHKNLAINAVLEAIVRNHQETISWTTPDKKHNLLHFENLTPDIESFIQNFSVAFFEGIARPYVWEEGHFFKKVVALERLATLFIIGLSVYFVLKTILCQKVSFYEQRAKTTFLLLFCNSIYCFSLWILLAYAAPNIGALNRFQVGFIPFLTLMSLSFFPKVFWVTFENKFQSKRPISQLSSQ